MRQPALFMAWLAWMGSCSADPQPIQPVYNVTRQIYSNVPGMDPTDGRVYVFSPSGTSSNQTFPLIAFAHGFAAADPVVLQYNVLLSRIASFGFVVVAPAACRWFCVHDRLSLHGDPPWYGNYYKNLLNSIVWARGIAVHQDMLPIDLSKGSGVVGHSMGGQAALFCASFSNASQHNITAAVMLHAFTHTFPSSTVPYMVFTGDADRLARSSQMALPIFASNKHRQPRVLVNKKGATHNEPDHNAYNPLLPQFVAAFLKMYVSGTSREFGLDFHQMIFGNITSSLCGGGDGTLDECIAQEHS